MPRQQSANEFHEIFTRGPKAEYVPQQLLNDIANGGTVPNGGSLTYGPYSADGFYDFVLGLTSSQAGAINLLRYINDAATVLLESAPPTQALVASTAAVLIENDGKPYAVFKVQVTNTGASPATISNVAALMSAH